MFPAAIVRPPLPVVGDPNLHAPDGILDAPVAIAMWVLTLIVLAVAVRRTNETLDERTVPLMGTTAAFIFAAQMFNFPVVGGTSGHLLGGVFAAVLLGPWAGTLVMACVIAVQALIFQDGGLLVMGANIFNMGIVGTLFGYYVYRVLARAFGGESRGRIPAAGIAAWLSVMAGAACMAVELGLSGSTAIAIALPAMLGVHFFIGIGEALITMGALAFIQVARPDLFLLRDAHQAMTSGPSAPASPAAA
jgi:cobalt/nickel transport system permease protein